MMRTPSRDCLMDLSSESSGSSRGEKSDGDFLNDSPVSKGKVIKEGFLLKRVRYILFFFLGGGCRGVCVEL